MQGVPRDDDFFGCEGEYIHLPCRGLPKESEKRVCRKLKKEKFYTGELSRLDAVRGVREERTET